jgi:transposase-like zinc-binding protein/putative transposase
MGLRFSLSGAALPVESPSENVSTYLTLSRLCPKSFNLARGRRVPFSFRLQPHVWHTCKSRFCPSCGWRATLQWQLEQEASLPDVPYAAIGFSMPDVLWPIFKQNRHLLHDLPAIAASVITRWVRLRYGARVLVIVVPHTFGRRLNFNCHLHILVSAGGLHEFEGRWIELPHYQERSPDEDVAVRCNYVSSEGGDFKNAHFNFEH